VRRNFPEKNAWPTSKGAGDFPTPLDWNYILLLIYVVAATFIMTPEQLSIAPLGFWESKAISHSCWIHLRYHVGNCDRKEEWFLGRGKRVLIDEPTHVMGMLELTTWLGKYRQYCSIRSTQFRCENYYYCSVLCSTTVDVIRKLNIRNRSSRPHFHRSKLHSFLTSDPIQPV